MTRQEYLVKTHNSLRIFSCLVLLYHSQFLSFFLVLFFISVLPFLCGFGGGAIVYQTFIPMSYLHLQNSNGVVFCDIFNPCPTCIYKVQRGISLLCFFPMSYMHLQISNGIILCDIFNPYPTCIYKIQRGH